MKKEKILFVMYHHVRVHKESFFPKLKSIKRKTFLKHLNYLSSKYKFLNYEDLKNIFLFNKEIEQPSCCLTFDDGYKSHYEVVFPELKKRKIQGFFFPSSSPIINNGLLDSNKVHLLLASAKISSLTNDLENIFKKFNLETVLKISFYNLKKTYCKPFGFDNAKTIFFKRMLQFVIPENYRDFFFEILIKKYIKMNYRELNKNLYISLKEARIMVREGMFFGNHTFTHPWLSKLSIKDQKKQISLGLDFLKKIGQDTKNWIMCYPYGSYNLSTINILKSNNCLLALNTINKPFDVKKKNRFEITRVDSNNVFKY
jgi:peptidoglycan/xylan/chitin deacetylase (PgdA/CDA1 family)